MERLTTLATSHSQTVDKLQGLEANLEKTTHLKASVEAREKKTKEEAGVVSLENDASDVSMLFMPLIFEKNFTKQILNLPLGNRIASKGL